MNRLRNKTIFLTILAAIQSVMAFSQQDPQFSQNMFNHMAVNPGFAGSQGLVNATMMNRQQWIGFEGNPQTTMVSINAPINPFGIRSGVGFLFMDDRLGFEKNTTLMASYAYRMEIGSGILAKTDRFSRAKIMARLPRDKSRLPDFRRAGSRHLSVA